MNPHLPLRSVLALAVLTAGAASSAIAAPASSWNLSRDMMLNSIGTNPSGTWTYMSVGNVHQAGSYQALGQFVSPCNGQSHLRCWRSSTATEPSVFLSDITQPYATDTLQAGVPTVHPGPSRAVAVRWTSPVSGAVQIRARLSDIDFVYGDGIRWYIDKGNSSLANGALNNLGSGDGKVVSLNTTVNVGQSIYFIVDSGGAGDHLSDSTEIDVLITQQ